MVDVALEAEGYAGASASYLGVYALQPGVTRHGRPTYKKAQGGASAFLFYTAEGSWAAGDDVDDAFGQWEVRSSASTPVAIAATERWTAWDGSTDVEVSSARVVPAAEYEAARAADAAVAKAFGDIAFVRTATRDPVACVWGCTSCKMQ